MKRFIRYFLCFSLPVILPAYAFDLLLSYNLKKSNTFASEELSVWNDIFNGNAASDIIICGSSRAWVHIDPGILSDSLNTKAYNLGLDGHNFWLQYLRYKLFLKYNPKPKLIIYSLDIFTLQKREDLYNGDQFLPYLLWNSEIDNAIKEYKGYSFYDSKIPLLRYAGKWPAIKESIKLLLQKKDNHIGRVRGYEGQEKEWNSDFDKAKKEITKYKVNLDSSSIQLFEKFIAGCHKENIDILFVYSPEYIEGQKFVENRDAVLQLYNSLSSKYKIPFLDFSNDSISFNKKYFYNASHLNKMGSALFTEKIVDSLKTLIHNKGLPKMGAEVLN